MNRCFFFWPITDLSDHGRYGNNSDWKDLSLQKVIEKTALSGFESSYYCHTYLVAVSKLAATLDQRLK